MTTPVGCISLAENHLKTMLADSTEFRTWVEAIDQASALDDIYIEALPAPADKRVHTLVELTALRPYAIIWTDPEDGFSMSHVATSSTFDFSEAGVLMMRFIDDVLPSIETDPAEIALRFKNHIGLILDDFKSLAGLGTYLAIDRVGIDLGPYRSDEDDQGTQGDYVGVDLRVEWRS